MRCCSKWYVGIMGVGFGWGLCVGGLHFLCVTVVMVLGVFFAEVVEQLRCAGGFSVGGHSSVTRSSSERLVVGGAICRWASCARQKPGMVFCMGGWVVSLCSMICVWSGCACDLV